MNLKIFMKKGFKFTLIGGIGSILNLSILYLLTNELNIYYIYSEVIAILLVYIFNYIGNIKIGNIDIN
jgi:putative flippase GtrA